MSAVRNPMPGGYEATAALQRERLLSTLRAAPTGGATLIARFGPGIKAAITEAHRSGLIVKDDTNEWWLTAAGRIAARRAS